MSNFAWSYVFESGKHATKVQTVEERASSEIPVPPPKPLLVAMPLPSQDEEFPLLVLSHGYLLYNSFYSQLIQHVASHGFIVVAPQVSLSVSLSNFLSYCYWKNL